MLATLHAWWTVLLLVAFAGIVVWAWSAKQRTRFDEAANIPFEDDDRPDLGSDRHG